jgi:competence protein ComEC
LKSKYIFIGIGVLLLVGVLSLVIFKDFRNGLVATLTGTFKDTKTIVSDSTSPPTSTPAPTPVVTESPPAEPTADPNRKKDNLKIHILDSTGTSVLVVEGKNALLIDGSDTKSSPAVLAYLTSHGITKLRYTVATNYHSVAVEGLSKILSYFPSDYILLSKNVDEDKRGDEFRSYLTSKKLIWTAPIGVKYKLGESYFEIVSTHKNGSLIVLLTNGVNKFLFTGDITRVDKEALTSLPREVDLYSVSSRNPTYETPVALSGYLKPKNVVIGNLSEDSATLKTQDILLNGGATVYKTDQCGTMLIGSNGADVTYTCDKK